MELGDTLGKSDLPIPLLTELISLCIDEESLLAVLFLIHKSKDLASGGNGTALLDAFIKRRDELTAGIRYDLEKATSKDSLINICRKYGIDIIKAIKGEVVTFSSRYVQRKFIELLTIEVYKSEQLHLPYKISSSNQELLTTSIMQIIGGSKFRELVYFDDEALYHELINLLINLVYINIARKEIGEALEKPLGNFISDYAESNIHYQNLTIEPLMEPDLLKLAIALLNYFYPEQSDIVFDTETFNLLIDYYNQAIQTDSETTILLTKVAERLKTARYRFISRR